MDNPSTQQNTTNPFIGSWKSFDEDSGEETSIVDIFQKEGKFYGKIVQLFPKPDEDPDPICNECPDNDDRKDQKILGMEIIRNMVLDEGELKHGTILDPDKGDIYDCKLWIENGDLYVRGYLWLFYRTQIWKRMS